MTNHTCTISPNLWSLESHSYPLVNKHSYWKWWFIVDLPINMVIFHTYVSLPEGTSLFRWYPNCTPFFLRSALHFFWGPPGLISEPVVSVLVTSAVSRCAWPVTYAMIYPKWENHIWLVVDLPLWKMMEFVNGKDDIPYMKWHKNVWNHQPAMKTHMSKSEGKLIQYIFAVYESPWPMTHDGSIHGAGNPLGSTVWIQPVMTRTWASGYD